MKAVVLSNRKMSKRIVLNSRYPRQQNRGASERVERRTEEASPLVFKRARRGERTGGNEIEQNGEGDGDAETRAGSRSRLWALGSGGGTTGSQSMAIYMRGA